MEQKDKQNTNVGPGQSNEQTEGLVQAPQGKCTVRYGVHNLPDLNIAGKTVGKVRGSLKTALNIDEKAKSLVNGKEVNDDYVLQPDDNLEFVRLAGTKGE
jgi:hypothetical protein